MNKIINSIISENIYRPNHKIIIHDIINNILNKKNIDNNELEIIKKIIIFLKKDTDINKYSTLLHIIDKIFLYGINNKKDNILSDLKDINQIDNYIAMYENQYVNPEKEITSSSERLNPIKTSTFSSEHSIINSPFQEPIEEKMVNFKALKEMYKHNKSNISQKKYSSHTHNMLMKYSTKLKNVLQLGLDGLDKSKGFVTSAFDIISEKMPNLGINDKLSILKDSINKYMGSQKKGNKLDEFHFKAIVQNEIRETIEVQEESINIISKKFNLTKENATELIKTIYGMMRFEQEGTVIHRIKEGCKLTIKIVEGSATKLWENFKILPKESYELIAKAYISTPSIPNMWIKKGANYVYKFLSESIRSSLFKKSSSNKSPIVLNQSDKKSILSLYRRIFGKIFGEKSREPNSSVYFLEKKKVYENSAIYIPENEKNFSSRSIIKQREYNKPIEFLNLKNTKKKPTSLPENLNNSFIQKLLEGIRKKIKLSKYELINLLKNALNILPEEMPIEEKKNIISQFLPIAIFRYIKSNENKVLTRNDESKIILIFKSIIYGKVPITKPSKFNFIKSIIQNGKKKKPEQELIPLQGNSISSHSPPILTSLPENSKKSWFQKLSEKISKQFRLSKNESSGLVKNALEELPHKMPIEEKKNTISRFLPLAITSIFGSNEKKSLTTIVKSNIISNFSKISNHKQVPKNKPSILNYIKSIIPHGKQKVYDNSANYMLKKKKSLLKKSIFEQKKYNEPIELLNFKNPKKKPTSLHENSKNSWFQKLSEKISKQFRLSKNESSGLVKNALEELPREMPMEEKKYTISRFFENKSLTTIDERSHEPNIFSQNKPTTIDEKK